MEGVNKAVVNVADVLVKTESLDQQIHTDDADDNQHCRNLIRDKRCDHIQNHRQCNRHQNTAGDLRVVEQLLDDVVGTLNVWQLLDHHPHHTGYSQLRLDDRQDKLILRTVRDQNTVLHSGFGNHLLQKLRNPAVTFQHIHVVSADHRNLDVRTFGGKFVVGLDGLEDCVCVRVFGVRNSEPRCCIQTGLSPDGRAHHSCFISDVIVTINAENQSPSGSH